MLDRDAQGDSIHAALMDLGFAWYPEENMREELGSVKLKPLPPRENVEGHATLHLVFADPEAAGPGTRRLSEIIRERVRECCRAE